MFHDTAGIAYSNTADIGREIYADIAKYLVNENNSLLSIQRYFSIQYCLKNLVQKQQTVKMLEIVYVFLKPTGENLQCLNQSYVVVCN